MTKPKSEKKKPPSADTLSFLVENWASFSEEEKLEKGRLMNWGLRPPSLASLPTFPSPTVTTIVHTAVYEGKAPLQVASLNGLDLSDLYIACDSTEEEDEYGHCIETTTIYLYRDESVTRANPKFKQQLAGYDKAKAKYDFSLRCLPIYNEWVVIDYKADVRSKKEAALRAAEALLRKAGRTVI